MKKVTVYTKYGCPKCDMTKVVLDNIGVAYTTVNVEDDAEAKKHVVEVLGFTSMPVVEVEGQEAFCDFRPDKLHELAD